MSEGRPSPPPPERYDEIAYRDALQRLGLVPPVELEEIQGAYRRSARHAHPDVFPDGPEREEATRRIQRINAARDYVVRHHRGHEARMRARDAAADRASWWLLPVAAVHALASVLALGPFLVLSHAIGSRARARLRASRIAAMGAPVWRVWRAVGPHFGALAMFYLAEGAFVEVWFGVSFLALAASDLVSLFTRAPNELRGRAAVARVQDLFREAERSL